LSRNYKYTTEKFIKRASIIHNNKYIYDKSVYIDYKHTPITITCPKHGDFKQTACNHLTRSKCPKCSTEGTSKKLTLPFEKFIEKANSIHNYKYKYCNYKGYKKPCTIICQTHGSFIQTPSNHLSGKGCQKCPSIISKPQQEIIDFIRSITDCELIINDRSAIQPLEIDCYLPQNRIGIEYHGLWWHNNKNNHQEKAIKAQNNSIKLIQIFEYEWSNSKNIVKSIIKHYLNKSNKIFAAQCQISTIPNKTNSKFCECNNILGKSNSQICYGLFDNNTLVSTLSFNKIADGHYKINRYTTKTNYIITNGLKKLLNSFIKEYKPKSILSYSDKRYPIDDILIKFNFKYIETTKPDYKYFKKDKIWSKHQLQTDILKNDYGIIYDAGYDKFILSL